MRINRHHGNFNISRRNGSIQYICMHYTGGTGSALDNCKYFAGGDRRSSADYFVDPDGTIWEYNDPGSGYYTWAVGDGGGRHGITNATSCHIEVVNTGGVLPVPAGMVILWREGDDLIKRAPRTRGDGPRSCSSSMDARKCSPHMRG